MKTVTSLCSSSTALRKSGPEATSIKSPNMGNRSYLQNENNSYFYDAEYEDSRNHPPRYGTQLTARPFPPSAASCTHRRIRRPQAACQCRHLPRPCSCLSSFVSRFCPYSCPSQTPSRRRPWGKVSASTLTFPLLVLPSFLSPTVYTWQSEKFIFKKSDRKISKNIKRGMRTSMNYGREDKKWFGELRSDMGTFA